MTLLLMSSLLSMKMHTCYVRVLFLIVFAVFLNACDYSELNNPYADEDESLPVLYQSFSERPKHLDPAIAYSENEYAFIAQIYEPPFQYHYLKRPYQLVPLTANGMPEINYLNAQGQKLGEGTSISEIAFTDYMIEIQPNIQFQPHPALAKDIKGNYLYHHLTGTQINQLTKLTELESTGSRELTAEDYVYQIKRLAHPKIQSPIAEIMKNYIVGFDDFSKQVSNKQKTEIKNLPIAGVQTISRYQYHIRIKGK
jgi:oligopeptide transport system substrate-binding protein